MPIVMFYSRRNEPSTWEVNFTLDIPSIPAEGTIIIPNTASENAYKVNKVVYTFGLETPPNMENDKPKHDAHVFMTEFKPQEGTEDNYVISEVLKN